jgi:hypothetical protein
MNPVIGKLFYWGAVTVTFAIAVCLFFSCLKNTDQSHRAQLPRDSILWGTEVGNPAGKTALGTEVGNPAFKDEKTRSTLQQSNPEISEMLAENLNNESDSLNVLNSEFDVILFMKQLP